MQLPRFLIYALLNPDTLEVKYIGQSANGIGRYTSHFHPNQLKLKTPKSDWINGLLVSGKYPAFVVLETCLWDQLNEREMFWIDHYGTQLVNTAKGGKGGNTGGGQSRRCPIYAINLETNQRLDFEYIWQTEEAGFIPSKVVAVCKKKRLSHKGHVFFYQEDQQDIIHRRYSCNKSSKMIQATCRNTGQQYIFNSIEQASNILNISRESISNHVNGKCTNRKYKLSVYNAAHMDEEYEPVNKPIRIVL